MKTDEVRMFPYISPYINPPGQPLVEIKIIISTDFDQSDSSIFPGGWPIFTGGLPEAAFRPSRCQF